MAPAELLQRLGQSRLEQQADDVAGGCGLGTMRQVRRHLEIGHTRELALPVVDLGAELAAPAALAVPQRVVAILDRQLGQAAGEAVILLAELAGQDADRPAVADQVMGGEQQQRVLLGHAQQRHAQQRRLGEVERAVGLQPAQPLGLRQPLLVGQAGQVERGEAERDGCGDPLQRNTVVVTASRVVGAGSGARDGE